MKPRCADLFSGAGGAAMGLFLLSKPCQGNEGREGVVEPRIFPSSLSFFLWLTRLTSSRQHYVDYCHESC